MNERIKELAKQAEVYSSMWTGEEKQEALLEKFAELIIKECAGICMIEYDTGLEPAPQAPWIAKQIKDHFGVKA